MTQICSVLLIVGVVAGSVFRAQAQSGSNFGADGSEPGWRLISGDHS